MTKNTLVTGRLVENNYVDPHDPKKYIKVYDNLVWAKGGDGTLIKAIHKYKHLKKPFYGHSGGTVGFLMNKKVPGFEVDLKVKKFNLIKVKVHYIESVPDRALASIYNKEIEVIKEYQAFNDVCIGGSPELWIEFDVQEKDELFNKFKGSGLIISTAQGSTGINKKNGGTILPLRYTNLWSITGDKTEREINFVLNSKNMVIDFESRAPVPIFIDGSNKVIHNVTKVEISKGDSVHVIFGNYKKFKKKRRL